MEKVSKNIKPLISVIVPVYNVEKYLDRCVKSIINQTYKNLEIIIVDDGSSDNCPIMCDEYAITDERIKVIHKQNGGVSSARNIGINISTGDYIAFIDSDDWVEREYFQKLIETAMIGNYDIVQSSYFRVTGTLKEKITLKAPDMKLDGYSFLKLVLNPQTALGFCHMKIYRKTVIDSINFNENLKVCEDALFNIQVSFNVSRFAILNDNLYNYQINLDSVVKKYDSNYPQKYENGIKVISDFINNSNIDIDVEQQLYNFIAYHVLLIAVNYCFNSKNKEQIKSLKKVCNQKEFKNGIYNSNYSGISLTRKITLFTLKHKLYFFTKLICEYRNKQNRR